MLGLKKISFLLLAIVFVGTCEANVGRINSAGEINEANTMTASAAQPDDASAPAMVQHAYDDGISGYYLGLDAGYGDTHYANSNSFFNNNSNFQTRSQQDGGITFGVTLGYAFNSYFAIEGGYKFLSNATATITSGGTVKAESYVLNTMLRITIPFYHNFDAFMKGGIAFVAAKIKVPGQADSNADEYRPAFALGVAYRITPNVSVNVQWFRVLAKANAFDGYAQNQQVTVIGGSQFVKLPMIDMYTAGISYRF